MSARDKKGASAQPFAVQSELLDGVRILAIHGELDLSTAPQLEEPLWGAIASGDRAVAIDFSECQFVDSTGIAVIVRAWQELDCKDDADRDRVFVLCSPSDQVKRVLDVTGLKSAIPIHDNREEALTALRA